MKKRINQILELLTKYEKIEVAALAEQLNVSQVTIRKDLDNLEQKGILKREHGFAILATTNDILGRLAYHYEEKTIIAKTAASLVHDGDTIMIESGSCCAILADTLTECKKNLTIITNSAFIADYIRRKSNCQIILMGGIYQQDSRHLSARWYANARKTSMLILFYRCRRLFPNRPDLPIRIKCALRQSAIWQSRRIRRCINAK